MIEMNVKCGEHVVKGFVLKIGELLAELPDVVIVDERYRADDLRIRTLPLALHEFVPNQIPEGFRTIGVAALRNVLVELPEKILIDCDADASKVTHAY